MKDNLEKVSIPNKDNIKGNITLLDKIGSVNIMWTSSNPKVISDSDTGRLKAGVVNRQQQDEKVVLTAKFYNAENNEYIGEKDIEVIVKAAPKAITEDDYDDN